LISIYGAKVTMAKKLNKDKQTVGFLFTLFTYFSQQFFAC
jgi:hypothetical protein